MGPPVAGFCVLSRKEDRASAEVQVLQLNPHKFSNTAAKLIDNPEHQLMPVVLNAIEKSLPFLKSQITNRLAKSFVFSA